MGKNFLPKSLYLARFSRYKHFCVLRFLRKIRKFKMVVIFGFFENWVIYSPELPFRSKISSKSVYLARFSRYKHFCVLNFSKKSKIQNCHHFWQVKYLLKLGKASLHTCPEPKILLKLLDLTRFLRYKHFGVLRILQKIRKFKMAAIFGGTKTF